MNRRKYGVAALSAGAVLAVGLPAQASIIGTVQWGPVSDGAGNYYEEVATTPGVTWDDANTYAQTLTYDGMSGYLATFSGSTGENSCENVVLPNMGEWDIVWIGATQDASNNDTWVNNQGAVDFSGWQNTAWDTNQPATGAGNLYMVGPGYVDYDGAGELDVDTNLSQAWGGAIIEFSPAATPAPEPATLSLLALGSVGLLARRRRVAK